MCWAAAVPKLSEILTASYNLMWLLAVYTERVQPVLEAEDMNKLDSEAKVMSGYNSLMLKTM
jgi:hypothetical protein